MVKKVSRRDFIHATAGGVVATWGGLRIVAGPLSYAQSAAGQQGEMPKEFVYGAEFFRPPNPPRAMRRDLLKAIAKDYKFNTIRIYCSWVYLNPERGRFDFSEIEEILQDCDALGLKVLMGAVIEEAPYWLEAAYPESRYVDALGQTAKVTDFFDQHERRLARLVPRLGARARGGGSFHAGVGKDGRAASFDVCLRCVE